MVSTMYFPTVESGALVGWADADNGMTVAPNAKRLNAAATPITGVLIRWFLSGVVEQAPFGRYRIVAVEAWALTGTSTGSAQECASVSESAGPGS